MSAPSDELTPINVVPHFSRLRLPPIYQTVSLRSTLAIGLSSRRDRSRVARILLRLFSDRRARATRKKSPFVLRPPPSYDEE
jgi:hypothetical protein